MKVSIGLSIDSSPAKRAAISSIRLWVPASNAEGVVSVLAAVIESRLSIDFLPGWLKVDAFGLEALARFLARLISVLTWSEQGRHAAIGLSDDPKLFAGAGAIDTQNSETGFD